MSSKLTLLIDLVGQLQRDENRPLSILRERDYRIGQSCAHFKKSPLRQLESWLMHVADLGDPSLGTRCSKFQRVSGVLLIIGGIVAGWLAARAVLHYDGSNPVNVVNVLAVFVGAQFVLLLGLLITMLPAELLQKVPGAEGFQDLLRSISPGNLRNLLFRWLPASVRSDATDLLARGRYRHVVFGRVEKWGIISSAQTFAAAFYAGALAGCLYLIVFSDLAFGWSTTLEAEAKGIHQLTSVLSSPWAPFVPNAVPSLHLIEGSRHFRLDAGSPGAGSSARGADPELLGGWWPFLVACMVLYGLLPRLLTYVIARWRYRAALHYGILHAPGVSDVLDRLNRSLVRTRADDPVSDRRDGSEHEPEVRAPEFVSDQRHVFIRWSGAGQDADTFHDWARTRLGSTSCDVFAAGGSASIQEDENTIESVAAAEEDVAVFFVCNAWEPPVAECIDFLAALSDGLGDGRAVVILPLGRNGEDIAPPGPDHLRQWQHRVRQTGDPRLIVKRIDPAP
jgi:hypothetical protein